jgi:hypothetical protein
MTRRRVSGRAWSIDRLSALSVPVSPMQRTVMEPSFWKSRTAKPKGAYCQPVIESARFCRSRKPQALFAAQVPLRRCHRDMPQ